MTGHKGDLHLSASIVSNGDEQDRQSTNLFHPTTFEETLRRYFSDTYGHERKLNNAPWWTGPINWKPKATPPIFSVTCEFEKHAPPVGKGLNDHLLLFPITPSHFIRILTQVFINCRDGREAPLFNTDPILALRASILDSVEIEELSVDSEAELKTIKESVGELALSATFDVK